MKPNGLLYTVFISFLILKSYLITSSSHSISYQASLILPVNYISLPFASQFILLLLHWRFFQYFIIVEIITYLLLSRYLVLPNSNLSYNERKSHIHFKYILVLLNSQKYSVVSKCLPEKSIIPFVFYHS